MSKVEVNQVTQQCGTTLTVGGGACKTAVVDATTVTLGRCGGTVSLASGATQSGFGRTGTVDWVTTPQTGTVTAATGKGYFVNTTSGTITVNLPAGAAGSIVSLADYAATWQTNNVTVTPNGTDKIGALNQSATLNTEGQSVTFVYVDSTQGWVNTMDSTSNVRGSPPFIVATGGTPCSGAIVCTNYKTHTFTGPGTLCVTSAGNVTGSNKLEYIVIAAGGGGAANKGNHDGVGGGGAGGFREGYTPGSYTASPLAAACSSLVATASPYAIVVGGGGTAGNSSCSNSSGGSGNNSSFSTITSTGGGGGRYGGPCGAGIPGGSGSGAGGGTPYAGGTGNTPVVSPAQGKDGGDGFNAGPSGGGGGGGATGCGINNGPGPNVAIGGVGATTNITGAPVAYAGGGGGGNYNPGADSGAGSPCGTGGAASGNPAAPTPAGVAGTINKGGGGGAAGNISGTGDEGGLGGSGVVIIRYKFQ